MNERTMHTLPGSSQFPTTRWTMVVAAGDPHRREARSALAALCENYWYRELSAGLHDSSWR